MPILRKMVLIALCTGTFSCTTAPKETPRGRAVQIIKGKFAKICTQVGKMKYEGTPFVDEKALLIIMKEHAAGLEGNAMRLKTFSPGVTGVSNAKGLGTAYRCPTDKLRAYVKKRKSDKVKDIMAEDIEEETSAAAEAAEGVDEEEATEETPPAAAPAKTKPKRTKTPE